MESVSGKRILLTGGAGFLGRHVRTELESRDPGEVIVPRSRNFDLTDAGAVRSLLEAERPEIVIHLAAEVGGIGANRRRPGRFFYANLAMGLHLIEEARRLGVDRFVQVGTVCSYPKHAPVPFREDDLWNGYPEETNAPYGIAKKALLTMLQAYRDEYGIDGIYLLPVNLYGPHDDFDLESSHVIPALIRKFLEARSEGASEVEVWGSGRASREFLYVTDCARAIAEATERYDSPEPLNIGTGQEVRIADLARMVARLTGFEGEVVFDPSRPDGQPRRRLDVSRAEDRLGFRAEVGLEEGLRRTVEWYRAQRPELA